MESHVRLECVTYERHGNVGVWTIEDLENLFETEEKVEKAEQHYKDVAGQDDMTGTVVVIQEYDSLSSEKQDRIAGVWSRLVEEAGTAKTAFVADGVGAMAIKSNIGTQTVQTDSFQSVDEAISWAG
ncbi:hypothetical protein [Halobiforma nitratireducens]|uniref:STAS/SEC14 domain-containing protein n=1 Tax=Halobiforma nitratireducens JCM 10879 TaxID=1227454 RepID=M0MIR2_9EURY|nr:hypothetical protein [Halobiforma nitratireducens]EMA45551.1 hypothetical protein C446_02240 [Halobiforma nitratireducens JCM 10879]